MAKLGNITIRQRLAGGFAIMVVITAVIGALSSSVEGKRPAGAQ